MGFFVLGSRQDQSQNFFNFEMILAEPKDRRSDVKGFARTAQDSQEIESAVRVCAGRASTALSGVDLRYRQGFFKKDFFLHRAKDFAKEFRFLSVINGYGLNIFFTSKLCPIC